MDDSPKVSRKMDYKPQSIICNTTVWYHIATGKISQQNFVNKRLIGTFINGLEFCASPNGYKEYKQLRSAVIDMGQQGDSFVIESPVEHMKLVSGHQADDSDYDQISELLFTIQRTKQLPDPELTRPVFEEYSDKAKQIHQPFLDVVVAHHRQMGSKDLNIWRQNEMTTRLAHLELTKQLLRTMVSDLPITWEAIELSVCTFDEWIRQLSSQLDPAMTIDDWNELLNLLYVGPESLYWTEDQTKTSEFIAACGCGHYLYQSV